MSDKDGSVKKKDNKGSLAKHHSVVHVVQSSSDDETEGKFNSKVGTADHSMQFEGVHFDVSNIDEEVKVEEFDDCSK